MLFFQPPPPPVSFSRDIAPVLAIRCNGCHGDAGGLSTRSYAGLMSGGNLGKVVVPGDAEHSLLVHFIDGRRGRAQTMPIGGRPLSAEQIALIRRWIDEGARNDAAQPTGRTLRLTAVPLARDKRLRVLCRVRTSAYLTMTVRHPRTRRALLSHVGSLNSPREQGDVGAPGEVVSWDVRAGPGWPGSVDVELTVQYAASEPGEVEFRTELLKE